MEDTKPQKGFISCHRAGINHFFFPPAHRCWLPMLCNSRGLLLLLLLLPANLDKGSMIDGWHFCRRQTDRMLHISRPPSPCIDGKFDEWHWHAFFSTTAFNCSMEIDRFRLPVRLRLLFLLSPRIDNERCCLNEPLPGRDMWMVINSITLSCR